MDTARAAIAEIAYAELISCAFIGLISNCAHETSAKRLWAIAPPEDKTAAIFCLKSWSPMRDDLFQHQRR